MKARGNCRNERVRAVTWKSFNGHLNRVCGLLASSQLLEKNEEGREGVVKRKIQFTRNRVTAFGSINLSFLLFPLICSFLGTISRYAPPLSPAYTEQASEAVFVLVSIEIESISMGSSLANENLCETRESFHSISSV